MIKTQKLEKDKKLSYEPQCNEEHIGHTKFQVYSSLKGYRTLPELIQAILKRKMDNQAK